MATAQKFTFDYRFDGLNGDGHPPPAIEPHPIATPEPTFTEAEMEAARQRAYETGFAEGAAEARAEAQAQHEHAVEQTLSEAAAEIGRQLTAIAEVQSAQGAALQRDAVRIGAAVAKKAAPPMLRSHAADSVEALVRDVLGGLIGEPRIGVNVGDAVLDDLKQRLDRLKEESGFPGSFIVIADPALSGSDCRVQWSDGGIETCAERVWGEIDRALGSFHGGAPAAAQATSNGTREDAAAECQNAGDV